MKSAGSSVPWHSAWYVVGLLLICLAIAGIAVAASGFGADPTPPSLALPHTLVPASRISLEKDDDQFLMRSSLLMADRGPAPPSRANLWTRSGAQQIATDDQGQFGSCTAHAMSYAFQLYTLRVRGTLTRPSRCYWYAKSRQLLGDNLSNDYGSTNTHTARALALYGWCAEPSWPYTSANIFRAPPAALVTESARRKLSIASKLSFVNSVDRNITTLQNAIAGGKAVIIGVLVYTSFMTSSSLRSGNVPTPNPRRERLLGGHAICLTGYDNATRRFSFRNSWGAGAGNRGQFTIPYDYACNPNLAGDIWAV